MIPKAYRVMLALAGSLVTVIPAEAGEYGRLVDGKGAEETYYACTGCHSEMLVVQQGLDRERWDELIDWMIEEQGMADLEKSERELILEYLSKNYGPDRPNFPTK